MIVTRPIYCSLKNWHLSTLFHINLFTFTTNQIENCNINVFSRTIYVGFFSVVHWNYISYPQWQLNHYLAVTFWEWWSLLASIRILKCGKSRFRKSQALPKLGTFLLTAGFVSSHIKMFIIWFFCSCLFILSPSISIF